MPDRAKHGRGRHSERDGTVEQPFQLGRGGALATHAERGQYLIKLLHLTAKLLALRLGRALAEHLEQPLGHAVAQRPPGERDAEEGLAFGVVDLAQVPLGGHEVIAPAG